MSNQTTRPPTPPCTNREISWLQFNERVLEEAMERENPPLERLKFLSITASNLDEFFMVRAAGLKEQVRRGVKKKGELSPQKQLRLISERAHRFMREQYACLQHSILPALRKNGILFKKYSECSPQERRQMDLYYQNTLYPILTPLAIDTSRPFPFLANRRLHLAVRLSRGGKNAFAIVPIPDALPRFLPLPERPSSFLLSEELCAVHLNSLFPGCRIRSATPMRLIRNGDLSLDEGAEDLMREIAQSVKKRRRGRPVRLELAADCDEKTHDFLKEQLGLKETDLYEVPGPIDLSAYMQIASLAGFDALRLPPIEPEAPFDFMGCRDLFAAIRGHDRLIHHPYESFEWVIRFLRAAAEDPDVLAIKQTLYRVSGDSPVIHALEHAAANGKQVTVLVELKARFDEERNIRWARRLERAGCHVVYGVEGLKTHCKLLLVVRRESGGLRRYLHIGTGNYNDSTARLYTDLGLFTCRGDYGEDATRLFNTLTGYSEPSAYRKFITAPDQMRSFFEEKINREIQNARRGKRSGIIMKMNALLDPGIICLLCQASCEGVEIRLIVRGICTLIPGIPQYSENIRVVSIVGQLLEHSRIYRFENAGNPEFYIGSADLMPRNLDRRIELIVPVEEPRIKTRLEMQLVLLLADNVNARVQQADSLYRPNPANGEPRINCQRLLAEAARSRAEYFRTGRGDYTGPIPADPRDGTP